MIKLYLDEEDGVFIHRLVDNWLAEGDHTVGIQRANRLKNELFRKISDEYGREVFSHEDEAIEIIDDIEGEDL